MAFLKSNIFLHKLTYGSTITNSFNKKSFSLKRFTTRNRKETTLTTRDDKSDDCIQNSYTNDEGCSIDNNVVKKKTLVLDLDETLVHSGFDNQGIHTFSINVGKDDVKKNIYVGMRPYVNDFLLEVSRWYDIVIYTAGLESYANAVIDELDIHGVCKNRYYRDSCIFWGGYYIKDLGIFNKSLKDIIIIDNSPASYCLHPNNAIPIDSWFDDQNDSSLIQLLPLLKKLSQVDDVTTVINELNLHENYTPITQTVTT